MNTLDRFVKSIILQRGHSAGGWPTDPLKLAQFLAIVSAEPSAPGLDQLKAHAANSLQLDASLVDAYTRQLSFWLGCKSDQLLPVLREMHAQRKLSPPGREHVMEQVKMAVRGVRPMSYNPAVLNF